jgi:hypothetical protein
VQLLCHLHADEPCAGHDDRLGVNLGDPVVDLVHVDEVAEREVARAIDALYGGREGHGAYRQHKVVVALIIRAPRGVILDSHGLGRAVDRQHLGEAAHVEVEALFERLRGLNVEFRPVLNLAAYVVRHPAVGK